MTIKVLADILSDSPSPAIVLSGIALKSSPNIPQQQSLRKITVSSAASQIVEGGTTSTKAIFSSTLRTQIKALTHRAPFNLLHPGDTAAFIFPNSFEFICCFFSTVAVRAVAAPLNPALKAKEVEWYLKDMTAKCLIIPGKDCAATIDPEITASIWSDLVPMARVSLEYKNTFAKYCSNCHITAHRYPCFLHGL